MFDPLPGKFDFPAAERRVLEFWQREGIFAQSLKLRAGKPRFVFYEGPPTANGLPHPGHCLTRAIKDLFPRYKAMCGYLVERKGGWDTHGLPVEVEVCKELGIHSKPEIEGYGVEKFVHRCIRSVWRYTREWEELTRRLGFWVNLEEAYATYHQYYVESVWWSLKTLFERGLLYQGHKVVWWWCQGGTALSSGEVGEGYRTVDDPSVFVKFPLVCDNRLRALLGSIGVPPVNSAGVPPVGNPAVSPRGGPGVAPAPNTRSASHSPGSIGVPPVNDSGVPPVNDSGVPAVNHPGAPVVSPAARRHVVRDQLSTRRRILPHWEVGGSTYFMTFRVQSGELSEAERTLVLNACRHFDERRHLLHAAVVMPDHVHLLWTPLRRDDGTWWSIGDLMHSIKSFTAKQINAARGTSGVVWQREYYDRIIRDESDFDEKWSYVVTNPARRGLPETYAWVWVEPSCATVREGATSRQDVETMDRRDADAPQTMCAGDRRDADAPQTMCAGDRRDADAPQTMCAGDRRDADAPQTMCAGDRRDADAPQTMCAGDRRDADAPQTMCAGDRRDADAPQTMCAGDRRDADAPQTMCAGDRRDADAPRVSLLVWTTTPWTLISNHFAAVHPDLEYALVEDPGPEGGQSEYLYIASELVEAIAKKVKRELRAVCTCKGADLVGLHYLPPFRDVYYDRPWAGRGDRFTTGSGVQEMSGQANDAARFAHEVKQPVRAGGQESIGWRVLPADFVTLESGTGLVHEAPAFGEVDFNLLQEERQRFADPDAIPLLCAVKPDGTFNDDAPPQYRGRLVFDCDRDIIRELRQRKTPWGTPLLYHQELYRHEYPFCPRAEEDKLIQYARRSWFVRTSQFKEEFLKNNAAMNWLPEHIREGRMGDFLRNNVDWALSRERYWGTPLPIWVCERCGRMEAIGSLAELKGKLGATDATEEYPQGFWDAKVAEHRAAGEELPEHLRVHKPYIDAWTYSCPACTAPGSAGVPPAPGPGTLRQPITVELSQRRRYKLPHWEAGGSTYLLTFRARAGELSAAERTLVLEACRRWDGIRMLLHAAIVMPDHVHLLCTPLEKTPGQWWSIADLMHSIKGFTSQRINKLRGTAGPIWQAEYYDRIIRNERDFQEKWNYVVTNPQRRGLPDGYAWVWVEPTHATAGQGGPEARTPQGGPEARTPQGGPEARTPRMRRVPEVIDCWWDAGSMPFAQWGFPHISGSIERFAERFPADFISEAIDQTRGWFYGLLAISTLLIREEHLPWGSAGVPTPEGGRDACAPRSEYPHPFRTCIVLGHIAGEDGNKMSKRLRNYKEPNYIFDTYGADAMRWFFFSAQPPWTSVRFQEAAIRDSQREFLLKLYNVLSFFTIYASIDGFDPSRVCGPRTPDGFEAGPEPKTARGESAAAGGQFATHDSSLATAAMGWRPSTERTELDRWIIAELRSTVRAVRESMDRFENFPAAQRLIDFVDALSNWYVRRSRERFWRAAGETPDPAKWDAYHTLYGCLRVLSRLIAPFTPFFAETMYQHLKVPGDPPSVHLCDYPSPQEIRFSDESLTAAMDLVREIASLGRAARAAASGDPRVRKVRQPLARVEIILARPEHLDGLRSHAGLIADELNVKTVEFTAEAEHYVTYKVQPNFKAIGSKYRELVPAIKQALAEIRDAAGARKLLFGEGYLPLSIAGRVLHLTRDEVEIRLEAKPGWSAAQGRAGVVVVSTELTPELIEEGLIRELVHQVQNLRKECELPYEARIRLAVRGSNEFLAILARHEATVRSECLVTEVLAGGSLPGPALQAELEGYAVELQIERV